MPDFDLGLVDGNAWGAASVNAIEAQINGLKNVTDAQFIAALQPRNGCILTDAVETVLTATVQDINWGAEVADVDGWTAGGIALLTCPAGKGGRYLVSYCGLWSAATGVQSSIAAFINGVATYDEATGTGVHFAPHITFARTFVAGDTLRFAAYQSSGANRNILSRLEIMPIR